MKAPLRIVQGLHSVVDNLVMEIAAAFGMGMADERGERCVGRAFVYHGLKTAMRGRSDSRCEASEIALGGVAIGGDHSTLHFTRNESQIRGMVSAMLRISVRSSAAKGFHSLRRRAGARTGG